MTSTLQVDQVTFPYAPKFIYKPTLGLEQCPLFFTKLTQSLMVLTGAFFPSLRFSHPTPSPKKGYKTLTKLAQYKRRYLQINSNKTS